MSSIRLFTLCSFSKLGPMHGHRLRLEAELEHVPTDISVGAVYGAMSRLASAGLLRETVLKQAGKRPPRQLFEITDAGRQVLAEDWAVRHTEYRLEAELAYFSDLLEVVGEIAADKRNPPPRKLVSKRL